MNLWICLVAVFAVLHLIGRVFGPSMYLEEGAIIDFLNVDVRCIIFSGWHVKYLF